MTPYHRGLAALSIVGVYWALLLVGITACLSIRSDAYVASIWAGTVAGTLLGHALALCNVRTRIAAFAIVMIAVSAVAIKPSGIGGSTMVAAFIPAAGCAFWSLGDRTTLVAFWFPAVVWMLSILEHTSAGGMPDDTGMVLLGGLALSFIIFVRVRETRRVALWCSVATEPLALESARVILKERPGARLSRAGWALVASGIAFGATAWVAPQLWRPEQLAPASGTAPAPSRHANLGLPCCPVVADVDTTRTRVKEFFDIGRGRDDSPTPRPGIDCRGWCESSHVAAAGTPYERVPVATEASAGYGTPYVPTRYDQEDVSSSGAATTPAGTQLEYTTNADALTPTAVATPNPAPTSMAVATPPPPPSLPTPMAATPSPSSPPPSSPTPESAPTVTPKLPPAQVTTPEAPPPAAPPPPELAMPHASSDVTTTSQPAPAISPSVLQWLAMLLAAALIFQLALVALRPIRRFVTLRHLRRPFWEETVDQRVSNAWQLALVGLRDAGWRASAQESPRELARRIGIDGVDRCATVLERARHGIGIDAEDLSMMTASAESAYRDARSRLGPVARAVTWLRWPLT